MKQVAQRMRDGKMAVLDVPVPECSPGDVLVRTEASLVSAGTERAKVTVARESLIGKARRRPDQLRQVIDKAKTDGLGETIAAVRARLDALAPLGYCATGRVEHVGSLVRDISPGDVVACGGDGAAHAELLAVGANLAVRVPDGVPAHDAAFTTLGAIALHGFRQGEARIGERVAVVGMGLVGQLTARIARAAGCEVFGIDLDDWKLDVARTAGALDHARRRDAIQDDDQGVWDVVLVTAATPSSSDPVVLASHLARDRGRVVVVGDVRLDLDRRHFYEHELELRLARSYGPGRYDREYEERGLDYPLGYVRWTERRNMGAFLAMLARGEVRVDDLVTHTFPIEDAVEAFDLLADGGQPSLALILDYPVAPPAGGRAHRVERMGRAFRPGTRIGFAGAGSFAQRVLIPNARRAGLELDRVATSTGLSAVSVAERYGFAGGACTTAELLADDGISALVVATRHDRHASLVLQGLEAGKAVLVEKPLCLDRAQLDEIAAVARRPDAPPLMVGFNRRHAPLVERAQAFLAADAPAHVTIRVNAGPLPADHWLNDPSEGGGRLLGEGCHFFDLLVHLARSTPVSVYAQALGRADDALQAAQDFTALVSFADGSLGTLTYTSTGSPRLGKELVEAHRGGRSIRIDDFASLTEWDRGSSRTTRSRVRDKGHAAEVDLFAAVVRGDRPPPGVEGYLLSTDLTLAALESLQSGGPRRLGQLAGAGAA
jgi:predicted dehydrogenase/threonine dehydrogenase-like Zn-dependent dehydrogenase